ncbi:MAG: GDP-mannose 4,6-dehydratase [Sphingopyxis sp.]|uniref:NAD-dependent epimerase/dehydratase family protein n=1 Tax=Sphingopyxis sp. TaxID=1908224 RepID=UPI001A33D329|nr:NAD-dependent epimerase/dehydratase family protein [Sphingopyxis sp.]MBJ7498537.1 GDP-mannose 4,6-dehydratase [Sphingopyxis sp.]
MAILVTGIAGFIGMHVAAGLLARGETVIGIDNFNDYYPPALKEARLAELQRIDSERLTIYRADIGDEAALAAVFAGTAFDRIVHLAAQAGVRYSIDNPAAYLRSNLAGHLNILELARHRGVRHLVYASSSSVYGANRTMPFRVEDRVDRPISLYAATKRADELMSETYAHLFRLPQTGLRFFTVYGPWGRPDMALWKFTANILAGRPIDVYNRGDMKRDFTYVDDIVAGVIASLDNPPADDGAEKTGGFTTPHRLYNIGNNRPEPLMDLIGEIERACGRKATLNLLPMQDGDVYETFADIEAIQRDLGYAPRTGIAVGVPEFVDWFRRIGSRYA